MTPLERCKQILDLLYEMYEWEAINDTHGFTVGRTPVSPNVRLERSLGWFMTPIPALGGATPLFLIRRGEIDRLEQFLAGLRDGVSA